MTIEEVLLNDWHPVADAHALRPGMLVQARLLGTDIALWRAADGSPRAWLDRCPHRGTRLSIGRIENGSLRCAYHGWRFADDGHCNEVPALPGFVPPKSALLCVASSTAALRFRHVFSASMRYCLTVVSRTNRHASSNTKTLSLAV